MSTHNLKFNQNVKGYFMPNFINSILVFLHFRKKEESTDIFFPLWNYRIFDTPEDSGCCSWIIDVYYAIWRFFHYSPWVNPYQAYREIHWFLQRGIRGWADCDIWSLDSYLSSWLPDALRRLKEHKHGVPSNMFTPEDCGEDGNVTEEGLQRGIGRWNIIMDKIIQGFEANRIHLDGLYEKELGEYPLSRPPGVSADAWEKIKEERRLASSELDKQYEEIWKEGSQLFIENFYSLWD